jgi:Xaa-Pro aminopeptidase
MVVTNGNILINNWMIFILSNDYLFIPNNNYYLEPGYYKEGSFGIRIEDDLVVVKKSD